MAPSVIEPNLSVVFEYRSLIIFPAPCDESANLVRRSTSQAGSFKASYSGDWNVHKRSVRTLCDRWKFHGSASAAFLGSSRESGVVQGGFGEGEAVFRESSTGSGTVHFACGGTKSGIYRDNWSGTLFY
jgi:hypothetical protein